MNLINQINIEYLTPSRTIETIELTNKNKKLVTYIYNYEGNCFRFFSSIELLNSFFQSNIESQNLFQNDLEMDNFLFNYTI